MNKPPPYSELSKGSFLIASPQINAGIYFRSVVVLCEHTPQGSFGLIINKPLEIDLPDELALLKNPANPHTNIRGGGPIQPSQMMLLHSASGLNQTLEICEEVYLGGDMDFLQEVLSNPQGPHALLCFGYTGWEMGQLEREFLSGHWFLAPGSYRHIFETPPEKLWRAILREMGGKYATMSMIPEDLSLN